MIFVDAGAFVARFVERDQYHQPALEVWRMLERGRSPFYTSNLVLNEVATYLGRNAGNAFAAPRIRSIYDSPRFIVLRPEAEEEREALADMEKYADQRVGFTDCVSFALMRREGLEQVFTFDRHFRFAGFEVVPES